LPTSSRIPICDLGRTHQQAEFDVALLCCLGELRRGDSGGIPKVAHVAVRKLAQSSRIFM